MLGYNYRTMALFYSILSMFTSCLSIVNLAAIAQTYSLILDSMEEEDVIISSITKVFFVLSILLTLLFTIIYFY